MKIFTRKEIFVYFNKINRKEQGRLIHTDESRYSQSGFREYYKTDKNIVMYAYVYGKVLRGIYYFKMTEFDWAFLNNITLHYNSRYKHMLNRDDGPARIEFRENGSKFIEEYIVNGELHREDGPAWISYNRDGSVSEEVYYKHDMQHRDDGPAVIKYENGEVVVEEWWRHDKGYFPENDELFGYKG